jgi:hypothetical protein
VKLPELKKVDSEFEDLTKFQGYVKDQFSLLNAPFLRGRFLTIESNGIETDIIPLTTTATDFEHKLGTEPSGFLVTYQDANAVIWWDRSGSEDRSFYIKLDASGSVNAKVWVF